MIEAPSWAQVFFIFHPLLLLKTTRSSSGKTISLYSYYCDLRAGQGVYSGNAYRRGRGGAVGSEGSAGGASSQPLRDDPTGGRATRPPGSDRTATSASRASSGDPCHRFEPPVICLEKNRRTFLYIKHRAVDFMDHQSVICFNHRTVCFIKTVQQRFINHRSLIFDDRRTVVFKS